MCKASKRPGDEQRGRREREAEDHRPAADPARAAERAAVIPRAGEPRAGSAPQGEREEGQPWKRENQRRPRDGGDDELERVKLRQP